MKNTILILIVLFLTASVFAQPGPAIPIKPSLDNYFFYPKFKSVLSSSKNNYRLFSVKNNTTWVSKRYVALYNQYDQINTTTVKPKPFMNSYIYFPVKPVESIRFSYPRYSPQDTKSSTVLELLGIIAAPILESIYPSYVGSIYHNSGAGIEAYLESTHHQHDK